MSLKMYLPLVACAALVLTDSSALAQGLNVTKSFLPTQIVLNGTSTMTISIMNPNIRVIDVNFTDTLPAGLVVATPNALANTCGGTATATVGSGTVSLAGGTLMTGASCTVIVNVTGTTIGLENNAVTVGALVVDGPPVTGMASAQLTVVGPPTLTKAFGAAVIENGVTTTLTFMLTNPAANPIPLTGLAFTDTLPAGLIVATPNGLVGSCPPGTIAAVAGSNSIALGGVGATLAAGASCTFSVNVTAIGAGVQNNTTSTVTSNEAAPGDPATASITVIATGVVYQLRYLANLDKGDSYVNFTNAGTLSGFDPAGRICVNVYTFDPAEELISCCACPVTPNGLNSLSARNDLISNTLTPGVPTSVTVKLVASTTLAGGTCNPSSPNAANLVRGMRAWATTLHLNTSVLPAPGVYQDTETPFTNAELSLSELSKLTSFCGFIQSNGSGFGLCKSCRFGALGSDQK
jgi:hypothetical protein